MTRWITSLVTSLSLATATLASSYSELLELTPLPRSSVFASFSFHSTASLESFEKQDFRYLPRALSQILQYSHTKELHLRFGSGRWDQDLWGPLPRNGSRAGGTGVELWAWVEAQNDDEAETRWLTLTNTLSGLFCASLNFIDSTRTIQPAQIFPAEGNLAESGANLRLLHGQLAREVVCTENLTPFLKFIPCKGKAGISSLFDGHKLFDSQWQSMSVDVRTVCDDNGKNCSVKLDQVVDMVLDIERSKRPRDDPIPRPLEQEQLPCDPYKYYNEFGDSCFPMRSEFVPSFSVSELFGRSLKGSCPLTAEYGQKIPSTLCFDVSASPVLNITTTGSYTEELRNNGKQRCFTMPIGADFDIAMDPLSVSNLPPPAPVPVHVERAFSGLGQERGGSRTVFVNNSPDKAISVIYLESLPWFMKPYIHTLQAYVLPTNKSAIVYEPDTKFEAFNFLQYMPEFMQDFFVGTVQDIFAPSTEPGAEEPQEPTAPPAQYIPTRIQKGEVLISDLHYLPAIDRQRGTHLELSLLVPPASTVTLTYDFDKALLRYTEYPPDPNRGFDVPPAVVRILSADKAAQSTTYFARTNGLLIYLPTPDFSMPYNVIILTSTVVALAFGSIFNIIVRRFVGADEAAAAAPGGPLRILLTRLVNRVQEQFSSARAQKKKQ